ncbi:MAG: flagellar biosynthesis protein FlhB [Fusobacteriaceae bacterium]|nr:flagellar biosynthesis protein FlhB [Fusobacteriaceae bacterium]MBP6466495.1 flagellar biosynthesis protein FlhB [Fusobacteriaceae bacterium]MBP9595322.1 flagellar biosynthesis protein FlhB [Fusobacteriaceae bacterium]MBU9916919.1 flagellar biosynthesis protein FlhB [Fusobacteriaceae bacterium]
MEEIIKLKLNLQLFAQEGGEKTEAATPKRRSEARKKGQVAKSQDLPQVITLLAGIIIINIFSSYFYDIMTVEFEKFFSELHNSVMTMELLQEKIIQALYLFFMIVTPILSVVLIGGVLSNYLQVGFLFTWDPIKFDIQKLDPIKGLKNIVSMKKLVELIKNLLKIAVISFYAYFVIKDNIIGFMELQYQPPLEGIEFISKTAYNAIVKIAIGLVVIAIIDYIYQRIEYEKSLKMTKQEIKEEYKQTEGDPQIKNRIKQMQRELLKKKMIENIPKATVVITNPTHISIALRYERGMGAPEVVGKGIDYMALRIREIAKEYSIPTMENIPLARAMYPAVEIGDEIPEEFYQVVAEILAVVLD